MDICNQRLMQQEAEFNALLETLQRYGIEDEIMLNEQNEQYGGPMDSSKGGQEAEIQYSGIQEQDRGAGSDRFQAMKTGLHVRTTLMKMSQHE